MPTPRDPASAEAQVAAVLARVQRRARRRDALLATAIALATFGGAALASRLTALLSRAWIAGGVLAAACVAAAVLYAWRDRRSSAAAATLVEQAYPSLRNLAVTANELMTGPERVPGYMRARVLRDAAEAMSRIDEARAVSLRRPLNAVLGGAIAVSVALSLALQPSPPRRPAPAPPAIDTAEALRPGDVAIDIEPPRYTGRPKTTIRNPAAVEALAGSVATIRASGGRIAARVNGVAAPRQPTGAVQTTLVESGSIAITAAGSERVLPLTVIPDARPTVRVIDPARDLRVADARASIPIRVTATDDLDLRELTVRYTVISGGGEQFTFVEGTLPAAITRESGRAWRAETSLALSRLALEPGDSVIYRAVAADQRPGRAGEASSDTYFVEVAGPGDVALEGIDMPPDKARYALSEAMIVVKLQRLIAAQPRLARADVEEQAAGIAAEQRAVRANFIFLLGGEVQDEVVEAEESHEIQEGRLANQARREIVTATVLMARVEQALAAIAPRTALPLAQQAVRALQRAFGHSRYLLRALPSRIRIDPARRLSGDLDSVRDWLRDPPSSPDDPQRASARAALADVVAVSANPAASDTSARLARLAERVLAIEPGAADLQAAARDVQQAREALARGDHEAGRTALQAALAPLLARAQRGRVAAPAMPADALRLAGAAAVVSGGSR
jgi:hypothetical protein